MDINSVKMFMDQALSAVKMAKPLAGMLNSELAEKVSGWANTAIEVGKNIMDRADDIGVVITSDDKDDINRRIEALEKQNAALNEQIVNS